MNPTYIRREVIVPERWARAAIDRGRRLVQHYANGGSPGSRAVSGNRGTESNPILLGQSKFGEAALALYFGLDPAVAVDWELRADDGKDVITPLGERLDAKTTVPHHRLIWSNTINHLYWDKQFDHLVAVSVVEGRWDRAWIEGFMPKREFFDRKMIATGRDLEAGTWYMNKSDCYDIKLLRVPQPARRIITEAICQVRNAAA